MAPAVQYTAGPLLAPAVNRADVGLGNVGTFGFQEPYVSINPLDPGNLILNSHRGMQLSTDAGGAFTGVNFPDAPTAANGGDTSSAFDSQGRLFWTNLNTPAGLGRSIAIAQVNPTTGAQIGTTALIPNPNNRGDDKQFIAADANPASPFADNLYVAWSRFGDTPGEWEVNVSRSTDGGVTWSNGLQLSDFDGPDNTANNADDEGFVWPADVSVAPNGDVYVAYHSQPDLNADEVEVTRTNPNGTQGQIIIFRSTDGGVTFPQRAVALAPGNADLTFNTQDAGNGRLVPNTPVWTQGAVQPWVLPDPARPGNVYVVTNDDPTNGAGGADVADVVIARSVDNGVTWAQATVPTGAGNALFPVASIDRFGNIVVMWHDDRRGLLNANNHTQFDIFATYSADGGVTWAPAFQVNDATNQFDTDFPGARRRYPTPQNAYDPTDATETSRIGEYFGIEVFGGTAYLTWGGNTGTPAAPTGHQLFHDAFALNGSLTVTGDDAGVTGDVFTLRQIAGNAGFVEVLVNGQRQYAGLLAGVGLGITFLGLGGNDTLIVDTSNGSPIPTSGISFNGGGAELDTLQLISIGANSWSVTGANTGTVNGTQITFSNTDALVGGSGADSFTFNGGTIAGSIDGGGGTADVITGDGGNRTFTINNPNAGTIGGLLGGSFSNVENLTGGTGDDTFTFQAGGTLGGSIGGGLGDNTINGDNGGRTFTINASNGGTIATLLGGTFAAVQNLNGGTGDDTFAFAAAGNLGGSVGGDAGTDTLDYAALGSAITTDLQNKTSTRIDGTFASIENLIGSASAADRLVGEDNDNTWTVSGLSQGDVDGFTYAAVEHLTGGAMADLFRFQAGGSVGGDIDGAAGTDTLNFAALGSRTLSLTTLGATDGFNGHDGAAGPIVGAFANINAAVGSAAGATDDLINDTALSALWRVTAINGGVYQDQASSRSFDFFSFEFLRGGGDDDTFLLNAGTRITGRIDGRGSVNGDALVGQGAALNDTMILMPGRLTLNTLPTLFGGIEALRLIGAIGNDRFAVRFDQGNPVPVNGMSVNGGAGADLFTTVGSAVQDAMTLTPGFLRVNAAARIAYTQLEQIDLFAGGGNDVFDARFVHYQAALAGVRFFGEHGNDTITLAPSATTRFLVHGGAPARPTFPGDGLFFVNAGQLIQPPVVFGNGGSDGLYLFKNRRAVQFVSIERGAGGNLDLQPWGDVVPNIF